MQSIVIFYEINAMYVCLCKGVTDKQIRNAINEGACSMRDLRQTLDVANQCGKCGRDCKSLLSESTLAGASGPMHTALFVAA
ncbi:bacterioferritin-associated ferredoxin [Halopseudomonas sp.]|uniref:bacterioferritin-associated ferredoxin n=1 Tax=Halopseudomonas sp. TaxID=2901191 RepID=UPI003567FF5B